MKDKRLRVKKEKLATLAGYSRIRYVKGSLQTRARRLEALHHSLVGFEEEGHQHRCAARRFVSGPEGYVRMRILAGCDVDCVSGLMGLDISQSQRHAIYGPSGAIDLD